MTTREALIQEAEMLTMEAHRYLMKHHAARPSIELIRSLRVMVHQLVTEMRRRDGENTTAEGQ